MEDPFFTQLLFPADSSLVDADAPHSSSSSSKDFQAKLCEIGTGGLVDFLVQLARLLGLVNTEVVFKENCAAGIVCVFLFIRFRCLFSVLTHRYVITKP